jgi:polar amino acid transport system permease protein
MALAAGGKALRYRNVKSRMALDSMWEMLADNLPFLLRGAWNTFFVSITGMFLALIIGFIVGLLRLSRNATLSSFSLVYIEIFRGIPMIVTILFTYFALPLILRLFIEVTFNAFIAMLISAVLWTSANAAEIVRGAVQSIAFGQTEASQALGMNYWQRMRLVVLPQAIKIMIPPMIGLFTLLLKGTAIGFIIEYRELIRVGQITIERLVMVGNQYASIQIYTVIMIMYFLMCYPLSRVSAYYEKKLAVGGS